MDDRQTSELERLRRENREFMLSEKSEHAEILTVLSKQIKHMEAMTEAFNAVAKRIDDFADVRDQMRKITSEQGRRIDKLEKEAIEVRVETAKRNAKQDVLARVAWIGASVATASVVGHFMSFLTG